MKLLLLSACILAAANAHAHIGPIAMANLTVNGATGYVKVSNGRVTVSLNLNAFVWANSGQTMQTCMNSGLTYHIHFARNLASAAVGGTACGSANTGGHYDPWYACGPATDQQACVTTNSPDGCIVRNYTATCTAGSFPANPWGCEVGDWSGKYGKLWPTMGSNSSNLTYWFQSGQSRFEVSSGNLYNPLQPKSVVFHCGSPRILCSPFKMAAMNDSMYYPGIGLAAAKTAQQFWVADMGLQNGPFVEFGGGQVSIGGPVGMGGIVQACAGIGAPLISLAVMQTATVPNFAQSKDATCTAAVATGGGVYDPTVGCVPGSAKGLPPPECQSPLLTLQNDLSSERCPGTLNISFNYTATTIPLGPLRDPYLSSQGALLPWLGMPLVPYRVMRMDATALTGNRLFFITCGTSVATRKTWCSRIVNGVGVTPTGSTMAPMGGTTTAGTAAPPMTTAAPPASTSACGRVFVSEMIAVMVGVIAMVVV